MMKKVEITDLVTEMLAQETPEAAATAAVAWGLRHAPLTEGTSMELAGHRITRIEPAWPVEPLIIASVDGGFPQLLIRQPTGEYMDTHGDVYSTPRYRLTRVVSVVPAPRDLLSTLDIETQQHKLDPSPARLRRVLSAADELVESIDFLPTADEPDPEEESS